MRELADRFARLPPPRARRARPAPRDVPPVRHRTREDRDAAVRSLRDGRQRVGCVGSTGTPARACVSSVVLFGKPPKYAEKDVAEEKETYSVKLTTGKHFALS